MYQPTSYTLLVSSLRRRPKAMARMYGMGENSMVRGEVLFYDTVYGVFVVADIMGLPYASGKCRRAIYGFHIHDGQSGDSVSRSACLEEDVHYDPDECSHPYHALDLPLLFGVGERAFSAFLTDRFSISEMIGKTLIMHDSTEEFSSKLFGNSENSIACGLIRGQ